MFFLFMLRNLNLQTESEKLSNGTVSSLTSIGISEIDRSFVCHIRHNLFGSKKKEGKKYIVHVTDTLNCETVCIYKYI